MKKWILRVVLGLIVLVIVLLIVAVLMIDSLAKVAVEKGAGYALGVKTTVNHMGVSLFRGRVTMDGLKVANPEGFKSPHLMDTGKFDLEVRPGSLLSETVEVAKFELDGLDVNIERQTGGSNVGKILQNLKRLGGEEGEAKPEPPKEEAGGKKVKVDRILIRNVKARFHLLGLPPVTVPLAELELKNVSSEEGGVAVAELVARLVPAILKGVLKEAEGVVPADFLNDLNAQVASTAKALGDTAGALVGQAGEGIEQLGKEGEKTVKDVTTRVGGLLKTLVPGKGEKK